MFFLQLNASMLNLRWTSGAVWEPGIPNEPLGAARGPSLALQTRATIRTSPSCKEKTNGQHKPAKFRPCVALTSLLEFMLISKTTTLVWHCSSPQSFTFSTKEILVRISLLCRSGGKKLPEITWGWHCSLTLTSSRWGMVHSSQKAIHSSILWFPKGPEGTQCKSLTPRLHTPGTGVRSSEHLLHKHAHKHTNNLCLTLKYPLQCCKGEQTTLSSVWAEKSKTDKAQMRTFPDPARSHLYWEQSELKDYRVPSVQ